MASYRSRIDIEPLRASTGRPDVEAERALAALCEVASNISGCPLAAISLVDSDREHFVTGVGLDALAHPRKNPFCAYTLTNRGRTFVVGNAAKDERFRASAWVRHDPNIRFYAGLLLETGAENGAAVLCVMDTRPRRLSAAALSVLQRLAETASGILKLRQQANRSPKSRPVPAAPTMKSAALVGRASQAPETKDRPAPRPRAARAQISRALSDGEFVPFYQPTVELKWGRTVGFEVLARWKHPTRGLLAPKDFNQAISDRSLTPLLTRAMLNSALKDYAVWRAQGLAPGRLAINVTSADLMNKRFADEISKALDMYRFNPRDLVVEATEGIAMGAPEGQIHKSLSELRSQGIHIALDDFGTGFASLQHLRNWPIDGLKLDRGFVRNCLSNKEDQIIIRGIVQMCRALRLSIVAEGIETNAQYLFLANVGCDYGQGFYFSKPIPAADVPNLLNGAFASSADLMPKAVKIP